MTRLRDLEARFLRREERIETYNCRTPEGVAYEVTGPVAYLPEVDTIPEADGVMFLCPKCFAANGGPIGTHQILCWFTGKVADDVDPKPGRWNPVGTGIDDLTFVPDATKTQSVMLTGGCQWHGHVVNGDAT